MRIYRTGNLTIDLKIVTPHLAKITIRIKDFKLRVTSLIPSEMRDEIDVSHRQPYEDIVSSGLTSPTADLYLQATVYIDLEALTEDLTSKGEDITTVTFLLGTLKLEVELFDLQLKTVAATKEFEAEIRVSVDKPK